MNNYIVENPVSLLKDKLLSSKEALNQMYEKFENLPLVRNKNGIFKEPARKKVIRCVSSRC